MSNDKKNKENKWFDFFRRNSGGERFDRLKILAFFICFILAFCLWMVVNLNRNFNIDIALPVEVGHITPSKALVHKLPDEVTARITGRGWDLINTYNDPPHIFVDVSGKEVNLFEQVRQQINSTPNISVQKVDPLYLQVQLDDKSSKKVPVAPLVNLQLASQYDSLQAPQLTPDSVTLRGAVSYVSGITYWPTDSLTVKNLKKSIQTTIPLKEPSSLLTVSAQNIQYRLQVAQYTEGEVTVPLQSRGFSLGNVVTFSPASVQVKYRIPLSEYTNMDKQELFSAYVSQSDLKRDSTGFVTPTIEKLVNKPHLKVESIQPAQVAYFLILGE